MKQRHHVGLSERTLALACAALAAFTHLATAARGDLDLSFDPRVNNSVNSHINFAVQADGKIIIFSGDFTEVGGIARSRLARLHADGTLDQGFNPIVGTSISDRVFSVAVQADGKIIIGGRFSNVGGVARTNLARLNADGTLDLGFHPAVDSSLSFIAVQTDGKILIRGDFTMVNGVGRNSLARLNADGTLDMDFHPLPDAGGYGMTLLPERKILIWGRAFIVRLNSDGTPDMGFDVDVDADVESMALQADGKILIGGDFFMVNGVLRPGLARLNADGTLDLGFDPGADYKLTDIIAVLTDGKILIGSDVLGGGLAQLDANGALDPDFNPDVNGSVWDMAIQADGKILIAGSFTSVNGVPRNFARLLGQDAPSLQGRPIGNQLILSWPTNAVGFTLQSTLALTTSVAWVDVTNAPVPIGAHFTVTNTFSGSARFYRLRKQ